MVINLVIATSCSCKENRKRKSGKIKFTESVQKLGNTRSFGIDFSDIDLDGDNDIFICNYIGTSMLWLNDGQGLFTLSGYNDINSDVHDAKIADLNGDKWPDIFVVNHHAPSKIYFNNGSGSFTESEQNIGSVIDFPQTIQLADFDADGDLDAIIHNIDSESRIWLNNGEGVFKMNKTAFGGIDCRGILTANFNDDPFPDLFISFRSKPDQIWLNEGIGNFTKTKREIGSQSGDIDVNDIDGDGDNDLVVAGDRISIFLNQNNTGTFVERSKIDAAAWKCRLFDADLDGDFDLISTYGDEGTLLWLNDGKGNFTSNGAIFGNMTTFSIECNDFDGDDDLDVILGHLEGSGGNTIYINESVEK